MGVLPFGSALQRGEARSTATGKTGGVYSLPKAENAETASNQTVRIAHGLQSNNQKSVILSGCAGLYSR